MAHPLGHVQRDGAVDDGEGRHFAADQGFQPLDFTEVLRPERQVDVGRLVTAATSRDSGQAARVLQIASRSLAGAWASREAWMGQPAKESAISQRKVTIPEATSLLTRRGTVAVLLPCPGPARSSSAAVPDQPVEQFAVQFGQ